MESVLVVDDEELTRRVLKTALEHEGYRVRTAVDGLSALAALEEAPASVLVTDLVMPHMDGIELITAVKRAQPEVRIIAMSGGGRPDPHGIASVARRFGADDVLEKPFSVDALLRALDALAAVPGERPFPRVAVGG